MVKKMKTMHKCNLCNNYLDKHPRSKGPHYCEKCRSELPTQDLALVAHSVKVLRKVLRKICIDKQKYWDFE